MISVVDYHDTYGGSSRKFMKFRGLSSDEKPVGICANGSEFETIDTHEKFIYNEDTEAWSNTSGKVVTSAEITTQATTTSYVEGQTFDATGLEFTVTFTDESTETFSADEVTCEPSGPLTVDDVEVLITCVYNGIKYSDIQTIEVAAKHVAVLAVGTEPTKTTYASVELLDMSGLVLTATYNDGSTGEIEYGDEGITYSPAEGSEVTESGTVTITYDSKSCTQSITVEA